MSGARLAALTLALLLLVTGSASAQLEELLKKLEQMPGGTPGPTSGSLGDVKIGSALKQALQVGTEKAVTLTGRTDGYFKNAAIKILLPDKLKSLESGLRMVGFGPQVDELVLGMNRAAERAAPAAKQIFFDAIGEMTIDDAKRILDGTPTAATDYFKGKTTDKLTAAFKPVVEKSMSQVGVTQKYEELLGRAETIPFLNAERYDLNGYVVGRALDGLFHMVGEEEKNIRANPSARVTDLLKEVFGSKR
ncbi:MAG TPA: DUF4197 domain-containing protein [Methylomirabilota bacterium]|nr:DUF4197 domain-containing protein [Methylomirabilota bacterium]